MAAVLVALYDSHPNAERARTELVKDGFPTDRVELTSASEPGTAGLIAAEGEAERFRRYFSTLLDEERHRGCAEHLARRVGEGAAVITVHPRGEQEITRAIEILDRHEPLQIDREHLDQTLLERAASPSSRSIEFTKTEYSVFIQTRVSSLGTVTQSLVS